MCPSRIQSWTHAGMTISCVHEGHPRLLIGGETRIFILMDTCSHNSCMCPWLHVSSKVMWRTHTGSACVQQTWLVDTCRRTCVHHISLADTCRFCMSKTCVCRHVWDCMCLLHILLGHMRQYICPRRISMDTRSRACVRGMCK